MLRDRQLITRIVRPSWTRALLANVTGWQVLRVLLGLIILAAALFKVHELSTTPYLDKFPPCWVMIVFTELEILFALWLFFVPKKLGLIAWLASLGLFSFFTCVTLYKALAGAASCGCFGRVEINPWYTLIFDVSVVGLLLWFRPRGERFVFREIWLPVHFLRSESGAANLLTARTFGIGAIWLIFCIPSVWSMANFVETDARGDLSALGQVFEGPDGKQVVVLEPEKWIDKPFPLLPFIKKYSHAHDQNSRFLEDAGKYGAWEIVLYSKNCVGCRKWIPLHWTSLEKPYKKHFVFIELEENSFPPDFFSNKETLAEFLYMDNSAQWVCETPACLTLENNVTVRYLHGESLLKASSQK